MNTLIVALAKNENNYIEEWANYHLVLGFSSIHIVDNNDKEGTLPSSLYSNKKINIEWKNGHLSQLAEYNRLLKKYQNDYDWIAFIDIDEYIHIEDKSLQPFLTENNIFDYIRLQWCLYDDNELLDVENNDYSVIKRFTHVRGFVNSYKCILHTTNNKSLKCELHTCSGSQNHIDIKCDVAYIKHYITMTIGEYLRKKYKQWTLVGIYPAYDNWRRFFSFNKRTQEKEDYAKKILREMGEEIKS